MSRNIWILLITWLIALVLIGYIFISGSESFSDHAALTACLREKNTIMFGSVHCPACQKQKQLFERGAKRIPFYECAPEGLSSTWKKECTDLGIVAFPTWKFDEAHLGTLPDESFASIFSYYKQDLSSSLQNLKNIQVDGRKIYLPGGYISGTMPLDLIARLSGCDAALAQDRGAAK